MHFPRPKTCEKQRNHSKLSNRSSYNFVHTLYPIQEIKQIYQIDKIDKIDKIKQSPKNQKNPLSLRINASRNQRNQIIYTNKYLKRLKNCKIKKDKHNISINSINSINTKKSRKRRTSNITRSHHSLITSIPNEEMRKRINQIIDHKSKKMNIFDNENSTIFNINFNHTYNCDSIPQAWYVSSTNLNIEEKNEDHILKEKTSRLNQVENHGDNKIILKSYPKKYILFQGATKAITKRPKTCRQKSSFSGRSVNELVFRTIKNFQNLLSVPQKTTLKSRFEEYKRIFHILSI